MELRFLGGAREVGRSAVLVNDTLLLDYGMMNDTPPRFPVGSVTPEAVVLSHGHLDHVGALPSLLSGTDRPAIHWTPPTRELTHLLARDTLKLHGGTYDCPFTAEEVRRMREVSTAHAYGEPFEAAGHEITLYDAGHIPGSAHVLVDDGETRLLYTGDFHTDDQRLIAGTTARPEADVVICESTYADVAHTDRSELERQFVETVRTTVWNGGTVVVPVFAIGRTQELSMICTANDIDCHVDGMGTRVTELLSQYPSYLRDPDAFRRAKSAVRTVSGGDERRRRVADTNTTILTTAGMVTGGPVMTYLPAIRSNPTNAVALTGYQVEGTPGRELLETGRAEIDGRVLPVSARVESFDFSAHADRNGLFEFLESYRDAAILVNHGDDCVSFATELQSDGYTARAPALNDRIVV
ncbi:MBL fold metallo-hydrolase [Halocatena pleomorpha]|uniref:MBL fold metallo-hydrolase n=1 Tax=Halocatena pleomorpha TaxID=1785090 RepID=A0A3P3R4M7_9EURY|nr:MBL fold metallo-hydrolase [Halocatena pleomorpha]RRJ28446.1 MBL fold metallo-hydrolase [Halocatena pleomorpha]